MNSLVVSRMALGVLNRLNVNCLYQPKGMGMKFLRIVQLLIASLTVPLMITSCGDKSSKPDGTSGPSGDRVFRREYTLTENGCVAHQRVTGSTLDEVNRKICEAAVDDARNNYCSPSMRALFLKENCKIKRPSEPVPKYEESRLTMQDITVLDYTLKSTEFVASWSQDYGEEIMFIAKRIAACGLDARGLNCLDSDQQFTKGVLFKDLVSIGMELTHLPSATKFLLRFHGNKIGIFINYKNAGFIERAWAEPARELRVPQFPDDEVELFHKSQRALAVAKANAEGSRGISCVRCVEYDNVKLNFVRVLNYSARKVAAPKSKVYQDALIELALGHGIKTEDLSPLTDLLSIYNAYGPLAKILVLERNPSRVDLRPGVMAYVGDRRSKYAVLGLKALGKGDMTTVEELFVIENLTGPLREEATKIVNNMKLHDGHIETIYTHAPLSVTAELMVKIDSVEATLALGKFFDEPNPSSRALGARALFRMSWSSRKREVNQSARRLIEVRKRVEHDPIVKEALNGN